MSASSAGQRQGSYDDLWRCRFCRKEFVVPTLARCHEERWHEAAEEDSGTD